MRRGALAAALLLQCAQAAWAADPHESSRVTPNPGISDLHGEFEEDTGGGALDIIGTTDTEHFRSARLRAGALLHHESAYDYIAMGVGFTRYEQDDWATDRYTVGGTMKRVERATGAGVVASAGVSLVGDRLRPILDATWNVRLTRAEGVEFIANRDFVETRAGLDAGTMTNFLAASADYAATDRLTLIALVGVQYFSDDNRRDHLRGRVIYALIPDQGLSVQLRARAYESSQPGGSLYFNPEHYSEADIGLRLRRSIGAWRVLAAAGAGREDIDRSTEARTYYVDARLERSFANKMSLAITYVLDHSSGSDAAAGGGHYTWQYLRAVLIIPF